MPLPADYQRQRGRVDLAWLPQSTVYGESGTGATRALTARIWLPPAHRITTVGDSKPFFLRFRVRAFEGTRGGPISYERESTNQGDRVPSNMETEFQDDKQEVIEAWYMDDSQEDQRLPHHRDPKEFIPLEKLSELGIISWRLNPDNWENDENLKKIREARGYSYMDICDVCPEKLPNYETKIKNFFEEHLHTDEEIRYCLEGSGYFDVRDENDQWIRVAVKKGGMIVLPAGMYHRFTLDNDNYIKAMRLFVGEPVWTPFNRPHDHLPARKEYLDKLFKSEGQAVEAR